ncbi:hypothetical protein KKH50_04740 [Patescibacteria group bacterium]|nr:hypothetical protein [Patescibacteria group bacterium]
MENKKKENKLIKELIETGSQIAGGIGGAAVGGTLMGPAGIIIGGAAGPVITKAFKEIAVEIKHRFLGNHEEARIGATYILAISKIKIKLENGETIRDDEFFNSENKNRSAAEEIFEGILLSAQREHEEKKLKYYANLFASIAFTPSVKKSQANFLLKISQRLSYQQLCILNYLYKTGTLQIEKYWEPRFLKNPELQNLTDLYTEITELDQMRVLACMKTPVGYIQKISISILGKDLYSLMELEGIEENDLEKIEEKFKESNRIITQIPNRKPQEQPPKIKIEPKNSNDSEIKAKAKLHQAKFREEILNAESRMGGNGHKLSEKDALSGKNFYLPIDGLFDEVQKYRPFKQDDQVFYNMISKKYIAYNFFVPIKIKDNDLAKYIFNSFLNNSISEIKRIEFEYVPQQSKEFFPKIFPFDVYIEFTHKDNSNGFIGIELIYAEEGELRITGSLKNELSDPNSSYNILTKKINLYKQKNLQELQKPIYKKIWLNQLISTLAIQAA